MLGKENPYVHLDVNLFGLEKGGKFKVWNIQVSESIGGKGIITIEHGQEGGKMTRKDDVILDGKQGRNPVDQAILEANARIKKQLDKNYRETKDELNNLPVLAMLAQDATGELEKRITPEELAKGVLIPVKFDGLRCLAKCIEVGDVRLYSRTNQEMDVPHISAELATFMQPGEILDGEIYLHGQVLQDINSAANRPDPDKEIKKCERKLAKLRKDLEKLKPFDDTHPLVEKWYKDEAKAIYELNQAILIKDIRPQLQFHVFDIVDDIGLPFEDRLDILNDYAAENFFDGGFVHVVNYQTANFYDEIYELHKEAVDAGFEGLMIRLKGWAYESGKRSNGLWKFKCFIDDEFEIDDIIEDKEDGCVYIMLNNKKNVFGDVEKFGCVMGTMPERLAALANKHKLIRKYMTVQFQSRFKKSMLPQFPCGKMIREGVVVNGEFIPST